MIGQIRRFERTNDSKILTIISKIVLSIGLDWFLNQMWSSTYQKYKQVEVKAFHTEGFAFDIWQGKSFDTILTMS